MSIRDHELVKMVGNYLISHANLNYVDLQDMVDTIQASSYRYSRMKKQVFSNLVRRAYQVYCEQNNLVHDGDNVASSRASDAADNASSDSDVEIQDPVSSSAMSTQITNLYMSPSNTNKPREPAPPKSVAARLPFRPAFEVPPSRAARQSGEGARIPSPACSDVSSKSDEDDLKIIEEFQPSKRRNGEKGEERTNSKTTTTTVVQTLQPIIKNIGVKNDSFTRPTTQVPSVLGNTELAEPPPPANVDVDGPTRRSPTVKVTLTNEGAGNEEQQSQRVEKRGTKRKVDDSGEGIDLSQHPSKPRSKTKISNPEATANVGLSAGTSNKKARKLVSVVHDSGVTFSDFGGNDKIIEEICKLLMHLKHPEIYRELGVVPPRGFLLHGAPGCGKTLLASAIAGELKMPMLKVAATELISGISGESENNIRDLFEQALGLTPCIIFIDEIDSITPKRETAQREMERRIVSQLLTCIDELGSKDKGDQVLLIGATNRIESIDVALRRAGRFDREICLGIPDTKAREQILRVLFRNLRLSPNFGFSLLAKLTPGYVGADLQALMREAAVQAVDKILTAQQGPLTSAAGEENTTDTVQLPQEITDVSQTAANNEAEAGDPNTGTENEVKQTELPNNNEQTKEASSIDVQEQPSATDTEQMEVDPAAARTSVTATSESPVPKKSSTATIPSCTAGTVLIPEEKDFFRWIRDSAPLSETHLENLCLHMEDFERALKFVQPSSKREGFATVPDTTWDDIGALSEIREELQVSILGPVKHASAFQSLGLNSPAGVLLCGPPGCGKTLLAKAVANEAGINFISVKGPELLNMYVGESERAVRQCFLRAKNSSPCVIFFDELDALCPRRSDGIESGSTSRVVNQLLTEMDGMESRAGVFVMAATNRPDIIDPAILRPGRLDKVIFVNLPTPEDRFDIFKAITKNGTQPRFAADIDLKTIAASDKLDGFTGADLAAIVREASIAAFRELVLEAGKSGKTVCADDDLKVSRRHFDTAILRTKPSVTTKDRERYGQMKERYSSLLT